MRLIITCVLSLVGLLLPLSALHADAPHPEPRVIVNVTSVRGPHDAAAVQRAARFGWGRIVRCYKATAKSQKGTVVLQLRVSGAGQVTRAHGLSSSFDNASLTECLVQGMQGLKMPEATSESTAVTEIRLAPGDRV